VLVNIDAPEYHARSEIKYSWAFVLSEKCKLLSGKKGQSKPAFDVFKRRLHSLSQIFSTLFVLQKRHFSVQSRNASHE
jgi:hypothetical protein